MASNTIIIVEDDDPLREHFILLLQTQGYNVVGASNGADIDRLIRQYSPVLIITDLLMPEHGGTEVILNALEHSQIPVIAISAYPGLIKSIEVLVDTCLYKPVTDNQLVDAVKALIASSNGSPTSAKLNGTQQ